MTYICSCSGGKDSVATIILAHEKGYPLDEIIFSEVMFDENISGELPEHIEFINNVLKPQCEEWGYKFTIVRANKTYMDCFNHIVLKSKETSRIGKRVGFPMQGKCVINRDCKVRPILRYTKSLRENIQYVGIAVDEPKRLERLTDDKISILAKEGYTEAMAYDLCKQYGLLSPIYEFTKRGGCWFCPNAKFNELYHLYHHHRDLFEKLKALEKETDIIGYCWNTLTKTSIYDVEQDILAYDAQLSLF
jgi:hypothetical protein